MSLKGYKYKKCRATEHHWQSYHPLRKSRMGNAQSDVCADCTTVRSLVISRATGEIIDRNYDYPDDYKIAGGYTKSDFRKAWMQEVLGGKK